MASRSVGAHPRPIRHGRRQRHRTAVFAGLSLLTILVVAVGTALWARSSSLTRRLPTRILMAQTHLGGRTTGAAVDELMRRRAAGALDNATYTRLVARAVQEQADLDTPWRPEWGDVIEHAWLTGVLTKDQLESYAHNSLSLEFVLQPFMHYGESPRGVVRTLGSRIRLAKTTSLWVSRPAIRSVHVDGIELPVADARLVPDAAEARCWGTGLSPQGRIDFWSVGDVAWNTLPFAQRIIGTSQPIAAIPRFNIAPGQHGVLIELEFALYDSPSPDGLEVVRWAQTVEGTTRVVPTEQQLVELLEEPEAAGRLRAGIHISRIIVQAEAFRSSGWHQCTIAMVQSVQGAMPAYSYRVELRDEFGGVFPLNPGPFMGRIEMTPMFQGGYHFGPDFQAFVAAPLPSGETMDVWLIPDPLCVIEAFGFDEWAILGETLVFEDVPLTLVTP